MRLFALVAAGMASAALAACPNMCSGHGTCSNNDICTCYPNWLGADCSLRACPYGNSWALDSTNPHDYQECSGKGLCDRTLGDCKCFPGYEGAACTRSVCPNDCSGHGQCKLLSSLETVVPYDGTAWDNDHIQACVCDAGFFGADCSQRHCPTGDDPLTLCTSTNKGQTQEIKFTLGSRVGYNPASAAATATYSSTVEDMELFGVSAAESTTYATQRNTLASAQFRVGYTDVWGSTWFSPAAAKAAFSYANSGALAVNTLEAALESIPGNKIADVTVSRELTTAITNVIETRYMVTFVPDETNSINVGEQNPLVCDAEYVCANAGCQPFSRPPFLYRYASYFATASNPELAAIGTPSATGVFKYYTSSQATTSAFTSGNYVRLDPSSQPAMPPGMYADAGVTTTANRRYDIRVSVVIQDPVTATANGDETDVYWTKVTFAHGNITADSLEYSSTTFTAPWSQSTSGEAAAFKGTLSGFTFGGPIPATTGSTKVPIPDLPGVYLNFGKANIINGATNDGNYRFYEILIKLPTCQVTPVTASNAATVLSTAGAASTAVDVNVENVECSNRGQCDRDSGLCACYEGYYGPACQKMTVLV